MQSRNEGHSVFPHSAGRVARNKVKGVSRPSGSVQISLDFDTGFDTLRTQPKPFSRYSINAQISMWKTK